MNRNMNGFVSVFAGIAMMLGLAAFAQEASPAAVQTMTQEPYGTYLTDAQGRTLYLFESEGAAEGPERMTEGVREAAAECNEECLQAWPAFTAEQVEAMEGVDPELLYTAQVDGRTQVVYNGWPLYYFARDEQPGQINGQDVHSFGGEWYIVSPAGQPIEVEGEEQAAQQATAEQTQPAQAEEAEQEQAQSEGPPVPGEELRTDGWAWTQAHADIQNPATIVGGPLQVQVNNQPGTDVAFWVFPGPRELDPHVFGTPDKPLGYAPPFPLYGVPLDLRGVTEDGSSFTQTTQPTAFSDNWTSVQGASVGMTVLDVTATDAAVTQDQVDFRMSFPSPDGEHTYTVTARQVLPHGFSYPFFGGVATNMLLHGFSGVGTPMMPTEYTYAAFWGVGTVERDGEVVNENQLIHVMVTEPVRGEDYELMFDPNVPPQSADPQDKVLHLMVPPFRVVPGEMPPVQRQPVQTGVMVQGPQGEMEQPFFHVMIDEIDMSGERLDEVPPQGQ